MTNVVDFPSAPTDSLYACGGCQCTEFHMLTNGANQCSGCGLYVRLMTVPYPSWVLDLMDASEGVH